MAHELRGRVWLLPDDIETAQICPLHLVGEAMATEDGSAEHLFAEILPGLAKKIQPGDILWAGEGFGHGSSREDAALLIRRAGVRLVLAMSFARIFYRNAINLGLPVAVGDPRDTRDGDEIQVNLVTGEVRNLSRDLKLRVEPLPDAVRPILAEGGLIPYVRSKGRLSAGGSRT